MGFLGRKKRNENKQKSEKEEKATMSTLEDVRKAYQDLSEEDKKAFEQDFKDRVDESVGEQLHDEGKEDSQTAKDRVDEAIGEEKAEKAEEKAVAEPVAEVQEEAHPGEDHTSALLEHIAHLEERVALLEKKPVEATKEEESDLEKLRAIYSN